MQVPASTQKRPRFDGDSDVIDKVLRAHVRIRTCLGDTQLDPDFLNKLAPLHRGMRKPQTNLTFKPLERMSAFLKLAQEHRQTWALGQSVFSCCFTHAQTTASVVDHKSARNPVLSCIDDKQPERAMASSEAAVDWIIDRNTETNKWHFMLQRCS